MDVNHHPPAVDVGDLQLPELRVPHAGRVQDHEHRAVRQTVGGVDHPRHLLDAQDLRQPPRGFGSSRSVSTISAGTIAEFVAHYHGERNHQGLANELIERGGVEPRASRIRRRQRLGGLLNYYCRAA